jgi:phosphoribosylanthranilate isomerase
VKGVGETRVSKIKICGLRREKDVEYANICMPDYVGFVFAPSKRRVDARTAAILKSLLDTRISAAGVFVNEDISVIRGLCEDHVIDVVQLHGDEDDAYIHALKAIVPNPVIKAMTVRDDAGDDESDSLSFVAPGADYLLFDAYAPGMRGGSGKGFRWDAIRRVRRPYFLAGGLNPDNAASAVRQLHPYCVDISSGVETDGFKDLGKMQAVTRAVKTCTG